MSGFVCLGFLLVSLFLVCLSTVHVAPDGSEVPTNVQLLENNNFFVTFTPKSKGEDILNRITHVHVFEGIHDMEISIDDEKTTYEPIVFLVKEQIIRLPVVCIVGKKYSFDGKFFVCL